METERVALIRYTAPDGTRCVGSGLLVEEYWVLTADHVAEGSGHRVDCDRGTAEVAEVVRSGTPEVDLALLRLGEPFAGLGRLGCARVDRSRVKRVSGCAAVGFPRWRKDGDRRKSAQVEGWLPTAEGLEPTADARLRAGWLTLVGDRIPGAPEIPMGTLSEMALNPWGGMSGAVVVADDLVVGVVRSHNFAAGGQSLTVTPVTAIDQLPGELRQRFWEALGVVDPGSLPVLPEAVKPIAEDLPEVLTRRDSLYAVRPSVGRPSRWRRRSGVAAAVGIVGAVSLIFVLLASSPKPPTSLIPLAAPEAASQVKPAANLTYDTTLTCPQQIQDVTISATDTIACFEEASGGSSIVLWDAAAPGKQLAVISDPNEPGGVAFSPDGQFLATGDGNGNVNLWNLAAGRGNSVYTDPAASSIINAVAFSPDGNTVAEGDLDGEVYLWNLKNHTRAGPFIDPNSGSAIQAVMYDPDGKMLAITDDNGNTYVWNPSTDQTTLELKNPATTSISIEASAASTNAATAFSPSGKILAVTQADGVELWNVTSNKRITVLSPDGISPTVIAFSPNGATIAASTDGNDQIYLVSTATQQVTKTISTNVPASNGWNGLEFSPDGKYLLAYANQSNKIYLYRVEYSES